MFEYARLDAIFSDLRGADYVASKSLARKLGVTERTIRSDLAKLNDTLARHGARIEAKHGAGYHLVVEDSARLEAFLSQAAQGREAEGAIGIESPQERQRLMLYLLLQAPGPVPAATIREAIYVGESTYRDYLRRLQGLLAGYRLTLELDPGRGAAVRGREIDKRRCFTSCVLERNMGAYLAGFTAQEERWFEGIDLELLGQILRIHLDHFELSPDDFARKNAVLHLALAVLRVRSGFAVEAEGTQDPPLRAALFVDELADDVEGAFGVELDRAERYQLYLHFVSNSILPGEAGDDEALRGLIDRLLQDVRESYGFDLRSDEGLKSSLLDHLRFAFRSKQLGVSKKNPLVNTIRTSYPLAFEIALSSASRVFCGPFSLGEDEVGYVALHVGAAIERSAPRADERVRALLVCGAGRSMTGMLEERLGALFGDRLLIVRSMGIREYLAAGADEWEGASFVISTQALKGSALPCVLVDYGLGAQDTEAIARMLNGLPSPRGSGLAPFFDEELFMRVEEALGKDELLALMSGRLVDAGAVGAGFFDAVRERERLAATDISSAVAIPHALAAEAPRTKVAVAVLTRPVRWNEQAAKIQIVLLLAFKPGDKQDFERLFDLVLDIARDGELQRRILAARSYGEFLAALAGR